jgi:hypothetical protein
LKNLKIFHASPEAVFDCLDDLGVTGMHMTESSMPMMGGKMDLQFLTLNKRGVGTRYRWTGKVLWRQLDFTVEVTKWIRSKEKIWKTERPAQLIIYSWFQMNLKIWNNQEDSLTQLSISYEKPKGLFNQLLCLLLGDWYCNWCLNNMLNDTEKKLEDSCSLEQRIV